ncbi:MAG: hypothetical protein WDA75_12325 [Candidatus Latescibacterota bacterium]|jgi:hypothetical protein
MKSLLRLAALLLVLFAGGVVLIKVVYRVPWDEALGIADQFVEDLLA